MSDNEEYTEYSIIQVKENEIYFYSDINEASCKELIQALRDAEVTASMEMAKYKQSRPVVLRIKTYGGEVDAAMPLIDIIESLNVEIAAAIEGPCCSAGTLITSACDSAYATPRSMLLIHQLSGGVFGKHSEMKDHAKLGDVQMKYIVDIYKQRTGLSKKKIKKLLSNESWLTAREALNLGFIDGIGVV